MNIFLPFEDLEKSAQFLDDKRLNKMIVETAQIICTRLRKYNDIELHNFVDDREYLYKSTHQNHPCTLWVDNFSNLKILCSLFLEYAKLKPNHKTVIKFKGICEKIVSMEQCIDSTPIVNCTNFKFIQDTYLAYQFCLVEKWITDSINCRHPKFNDVKANFLIA